MAHPLLLRAAKCIEQARALNDEFPDKSAMPAEVARRIDKLLDEAGAARRDWEDQYEETTGKAAPLSEPVYKHDMGAAMTGRASAGGWFDANGVLTGDLASGDLTGKHVAGPAGWSSAATKALRGLTNDAGSKAVVSGSIELPGLLVDAVGDAQGPRRLLQLIPTKPIGENNYGYLQQTVRTTLAGPIPDLGQKPKSTYTFVEKQDRARVIAHLSDPLPQRFLVDADEEVSRLLRSEMAYGLLTALELQVAQGSGVLENITGLTASTGTTAVPFATDLPTTLRKARTALDELEESPTAWVFNPADAEVMDLTKTTGDGTFLDWSRILGTIPVVVSTACPAGTGFLADWRLTRLYVREASRLDMDTSGANFETNAVTFRAEQRCNFALLRPQAVAIVDLTSA